MVRLAFPSPPELEPLTDEKRQGERVPVGLRVRLKFPDLAAFVAGYGTNLSRGGAFLEGVAPRPEGAVLRFELLLADGSAALRGEGRVVWSRAGVDRPGVAVRFTRLDAKSKSLIDELVASAKVRSASIPPPPSSARVAVTPSTGRRGTIGNFASANAPTKSAVAQPAPSAVATPRAEPSVAAHHAERSAAARHAMHVDVSSVDDELATLAAGLVQRARSGETRRRAIGDWIADLDGLAREVPAVATVKSTRGVNAVPAVPPAAAARHEPIATPPASAVANLGEAPSDAPEPIDDEIPAVFGIRAAELAGTPPQSQPPPVAPEEHPHAVDLSLAREPSERPAPSASLSLPPALAPESSMAAGRNAARAASDGHDEIIPFDDEEELPTGIVALPPIPQPGRMPAAATSTELSAADVEADLPNMAEPAPSTSQPDAAHAAAKPTEEVAGADLIPHAGPSDPPKAGRSLLRKLLRR